MEIVKTRTYPHCELCNSMLKISKLYQNIMVNGKWHQQQSHFHCGVLVLPTKWTCNLNLTTNSRLETSTKPYTSVFMNNGITFSKKKLKIA
jgi:hypothetical protein